MVSFAHGRTVTLIRRVKAAEPDSDGNDVYTDTPIDIDGCAVWPGSTSEDAQGRETVTATTTVLLPPGTVVRPTDRVRIDGDLHEIDGQPAEWKSPLSGFEAGVQVTLIRVTG